MLPPRIVTFLALVLTVAAGTVAAQQYVGGHPRFEELALLLDEEAQRRPALTRAVDITMSGSLTEFAVVFSRETGLNLTVDPRLTQEVVANFAGTRPREILSYLCQFYDLDLAVSGSILSLVPFDAPAPDYRPREPRVEVDRERGRVSYDLTRDTLDYVLRALTRASGRQVVATAAAGVRRVSGFTKAATFEAALDQLATRNSLSVAYDEEQAYFVIDILDGGGVVAGEESGTNEGGTRITASRRSRGRASASPTSGRARGRSTSTRRQRQASLITVAEDSLGGRRYSIDAEGASLEAALAELAAAGGQSFVPLGQVDTEFDLRLTDRSYDELLEGLLGPFDLGSRELSGVLLVGKPTERLLRGSERIELMHRTVKDLATSLPSDLTEGLEVQEFLQLNSLIVSGAPRAVKGLRDFVTEIDRHVPVVTIELLIVDVQSNANLSAGVEVGVGTEPTKPTGLVYPELDLSLGARSINQLLDLLAGNGVINLGPVTPNFYARVQAAEDNGFARVHSKPRLSTINGQEASLSLGETRYYQVQRTTLAGNLNPVTLQDVNFESVQADFTITILPVVSGDGTVTLDIDVEQSDFVGRLQSNAPPAQVSRSFNSLIRMGDGEMIVLGGLESRGVNDSGRGVPLLSRVPVLKWLFSSRQKSRNKSKLLVFVRPRVLY